MILSFVYKMELGILRDHFQNNSLKQFHISLVNLPLNRKEDLGTFPGHLSCFIPSQRQTSWAWMLMPSHAVG